VLGGDVEEELKPGTSVEWGVGGAVGREWCSWSQTGGWVCCWLHLLMLSYS
jgi:hypothetical protein